MHRILTQPNESLDKKQDYDSIIIEKDVDISSIWKIGTFQAQLSACFYQNKTLQSTKSQSQIQQSNKENHNRQFQIRQTKLKPKKLQTTAQSIQYYTPTALLQKHHQNSKIATECVKSNNNVQQSTYKGRRLFESPKQSNGIQVMMENLKQLHNLIAKQSKH